MSNEKEKKSSICPTHKIIESHLEVDEPAKEPAANSLSKRRINKLFRMFCIHRAAYHEAGPTLIEAEKCSACLLREIPWVKKDGQMKDLCYAIWQEGALNA